MPVCVSVINAVWCDSARDTYTARNHKRSGDHETGKTPGNICNALGRNLGSDGCGGFVSATVFWDSFILCASVPVIAGLSGAVGDIDTCPRRTSTADALELAPPCP